ncbi:Bromodomain containing protein [Histomonas meleagridis]|uniref:Bromodomain containing protein n=1 Tax=Histomonas meleagridis TaxID=135588 RepID=UPI00355977AB|nr:Bromodomain containing protein [Histomonas meleagridis]KAH0804227.1 Bromodomain containing protein [Histomonas meleagridis]
MPIPPHIKEKCIEIMNKLMERPCSSLFLTPVNPERDGAPDYYNVVKKPVDLGTIKKRLEDDEYQSVNAWAREMSLIWGNAEKFNGKDSILFYLALEIKKHFEKEYQNIADLSLQSWIQTVSKLKDKLDDLLDEPPEPITKFATVSEKPDPNQLKPFTDEEMDAFIKSTMYLSSKQDMKKMLHIIRSYEPHFATPSPDMEIDVNTLSVSTLFAMRNYVNQRLKDLSITIPKN